MNLSTLSDHFINGHTLSDGFAAGMSSLTPDQVTAFKLPLLNSAQITAVSYNAAIAATAATITGVIPKVPFYLRDINPTTGLPYVDVKYAVGTSASLVLATFSGLPFMVEAASTAAGYGVLKLFNLPRGRHSFNGGTLIFTSVDWSTNYSVVAASGAAGTVLGTGGSGDFSLGHTATADTTLSTTEVDIVASTALIDPFVAGVGNNLATPGLVLNGPTEFNNSTTAASSTLNTIYLNMLVDAADIADDDAAAFFLTGYLRMYYTWLGDF